MTGVVSATFVVVDVTIAAVVGDDEVDVDIGVSLAVVSPTNGAGSAYWAELQAANSKTTHHNNMPNRSDIRIAVPFVEQYSIVVI